MVDEQILDSKKSSSRSKSLQSKSSGKDNKDKTATGVRFPGSALLFKFCLAIMNHRSDRKSSSIHDQEIGNILDYNPSDTSHWKKGKKAVKSIHALDALAETLDVDVELLQTVASAAIDFEEAWVEFLECEELRSFQMHMSELKVVERVERNKKLEMVAARILSEAGISAAPVFLPELFNCLDFVTLQPVEVVDRLARSTKTKQNQYTIRYRKGDIRAHTRLSIAKELAKILIVSERERFSELPEKNEEFLAGDVSALASAILIPQTLLRTNIAKQNLKLSLVKTLSEMFWTPKCTVRARVANLALQKSSRETLQAEPLVVMQMGMKRNVVRDFNDDDSMKSAS
jgi:hypothetical protein